MVERVRSHGTDQGKKGPSPQDTPRCPNVIAGSRGHPVADRLRLPKAIVDMSEVTPGIKPPTHGKLDGFVHTNLKRFGCFGGTCAVLWSSSGGWVGTSLGWVFLYDTMLAEDLAVITSDEWCSLYSLSSLDCTL